MMRYFLGLNSKPAHPKKFLLPEYKMSTQRVRANTRDGCSFFVNISTGVVIGDFFLESGAVVPALPAGVEATPAVGTLLLRDMGKTIILPGAGPGTIPRRLRKIQVVAPGNAVGGTAPGYGTAFIELGNRQGGATGLVSAVNVLKWASVSIPSYL